MGVLATCAAFALVGVLVAGLLVYYSHRGRLPLYVFLTVFVGWFIPFSVVLLLPIDLAQSGAKQPLFFIPADVLYTLWRAAWWISALFTWVVFPWMQNYVESGYRGRWQRFTSAIFTNLRNQLVILVFSTIVLVYVVVSTKISSWSAVTSTIIALANSWGLVIVIVLMGHGLVDIPRRMWRSASLRDRQRQLERQAVVVWDAKTEAAETLAEVGAQVSQLETQVSGEMRQWVRELMVLCLAVEHRQTTEPVDWVDDEYLASLTRKVRKAVQLLKRYTSEWNSLMREASLVQDILAAESSSRRELTFRSRANLLSPGVAYIVFVLVEPIVRRGIAVILGFLSTVIVVFEVFKAKEPLASVGGEWVEILSVGILTYMAVCTYSTLLWVRVFNLYALVPGHTDAASLIFFASYLCRLTFPLSYNYNTLIRGSRSVFEEFFGSSVNLTSLGAGFNKWFPLVILVPVVGTLLDVCGRVKRVFGLGYFVDEEDMEEGQIEGRVLIERGI